jgi:PAS domain S-box-containing protein
MSVRGAAEEEPVESARRAAFTSLEMFAQSSDVLALVDRGGVILAISRPFVDGAAVGRSFVDLFAPEHVATLRAAVERGRPAKLDAAVAGTWFQVGVAPVNGGANVAIVAAEITTRKENEERLVRAEKLLVDTEGAAHLGTWEWDVREPNAVWSDELYRIYGLTRDEYRPSYEGYLAMVHPDDRAHVMAATERVFREHRPYSHDERILRPDGSIRYLHTWAQAILDERGQLVRLLGVCQDITDRKLAELALEERAVQLARSNDRLRTEIAERARVEQLLRRAQKLEAIGRVAGGIAHDFNNMLSVVSGYTNLLLAREVGDERAKAYLGEILSAVQHASRMTHQLLAFGNGRIVEREPIELDQVVVEMTQLLRRLIGEDVELVQQLGSAGEIVDANRGQIEQLIVNLVVNARDAMPKGGRLTVTTTPVSIDNPDAKSLGLAPGEYVSLVVEDSGVGMTDEVQAQIFEPFFTTKEEGRGTGLGLATVYGIVKQSGGAISVSSRVDEGTRVAVYLPRRADDAPSAQRATPSERPSRGCETVLLVEDQPAVREVVREALVSFGYTVLTAEGPLQALELAAQHAPAIDLLLTDAVMPKMSGRELAEQLAATRPTTRVLYMSGHTSDVILRKGVLDGTVAYLSKPFTPNELAARIRAVLDAPAR